MITKILKNKSGDNAEFYFLDDNAYDDYLNSSGKCRIFYHNVEKDVPVYVISLPYEECRPYIKTHPVEGYDFAMFKQPDLPPETLMKPVFLPYILADSVPMAISLSEKYMKDVAFPVIPVPYDRDLYIPFNVTDGK